MAGHSQSPVAHWYFDFISPFAYLQMQRLAQLRVAEICYRPVLFAGLLKHWGQLGPAEIKPKRRFTYRYVVWCARHQGIELRLPPAHPFNPLPVLRLSLALECQPEVVRGIFDFIWREGRDPNQEWPVLCERLGLSGDEAGHQAQEEGVKDRLRESTEAAIAAGVFGVPTLRINDEVFWGADATDMAVDYLRNPGAFENAQMQRATDLPFAIERNRYR